MTMHHKQRTRLLLVAMTLLALGAPAAAWATDYEPAACADHTPHKVRFVKVAPGVKLEVLDFGGSNDPMVLLTGIGDNAHVWDDFAYQFTDFFRVIGITRRGFGASDQPAHGYDVRTRARDDIAVLDRFGIDKAVFVGHSIAGSELSQLGLAHPRRVDKLVYLDTPDLSRRLRPRDGESLPLPPFADEDFSSLQDIQAAVARFQGHREPDAALCNLFRFSPSGRIVGPVTPGEIDAKIQADAGKQPPTNWRKIRAPRLGIFAPFELELRQPWYWYLSPDQQAAFDRAWPAFVEWHVDFIERFGSHHPDSPEPIVRELPGAPHYVYINNEAEVVHWIRDFLGIPPRS